MGVLGWTPAHSSYFNTISSLFSSLSAGKLVLPFMKRAGNRMAFQQGCLIATMAYVGCGLSWVGSSKVRTALQYGLSVALLQAWPNSPPRVLIIPLELEARCHSLRNGWKTTQLR